MRYWLITSTTYGTWLPGDQRGFVGNVRDQESQSRETHNVAGTPYDADMPGLFHATRTHLKGPAVYFTGEQATVLLEQFRETISYRKWELFALAVMNNHFHAVLGVENDPDPAKILSDLKAYGSRKLNALFERPKSGTWWTTNGSTRKIKDVAGLHAAIAYVKNQEFPLVVWIREGL